MGVKCNIKWSCGGISSACYTADIELPVSTYINISWIIIL